MSTRPAMIHFPGADGAMLAARLDLPAQAPRAYALFAHCFTCSKESLAATRISAALTQHGIGVLRFDFTGLGGSAGDFSNTNFSSNVADLIAAANWLTAHHGAPKILIGHSLGGAAVLAAAGKIAGAVAVATIGAPYGPAHVARLLGAATAEIESAGEAEVLLAGRAFRIKKQFLEDISSQNTTAHIAALGKALLIMHSPRDTTVSIDNQGAEESIELRADAARHGLDLVKAFPVFGTGGGSFYTDRFKYTNRFHPTRRQHLPCCQY